MPLWTNTDGTGDDKPKFVRGTAAYNYDQSDESSDPNPSLDDVLGADPDEVAATPGIAHTGWVVKKPRTRKHVVDGNETSTTSTQYETLVALSEMAAGDADPDSYIDQDEALLEPWGNSSSSSSSGTIA